MFSIVIPTKNEQDNLERLLISIKSQDLKPDQIVVSDDSTDGTREVARRYGAEVVQGVSDGRVGVGRNRGASVVQSKYIVFFDADMELSPGFLRKFVYTFIADDLDIATCYLAIGSKKLGSMVYYGSWNALKRFGAATKFITTESGSCMIVKKEMFDKVGGFSEDMRVGEDSNLVKKFLKAHAKYKVIKMNIKTSTRRQDKGPVKFMLMVGGLFGLFIVTRAGWKILHQPRRLFERMYGQTGGE